MGGGAPLPKEPKALALARKQHLIVHQDFSGEFQPCHGAPREEVRVTPVLRPEALWRPGRRWCWDGGGHSLGR